MGISIFAELTIPLPADGLHPHVDVEGRDSRRWWQRFGCMEETPATASRLVSLGQRYGRSQRREARRPPAVQETITTKRPPIDERGVDHTR